MNSSISIYIPTYDMKGKEIKCLGLQKDQNLIFLIKIMIQHEILENIIGKINEWGFTIKAKGRFAFVNCPQIGVLFCSKNKL